ncbi:MAG: autotransporter-associated beta strand repeat-containing protein, partial [Akkermansiaceae bacterium]|nr:autotransporter-associated beta strand repeat-containing protein [Verrucomicrobiales bacterium]
WNSAHWNPGPIGGTTSATNTDIWTINSGTVKFTDHDTFGNADANPLLTINVNGATLTNEDAAFGKAFTALGVVNLSSGTITTTGGAFNPGQSHESFSLKNTISSSGNSSITSTNATFGVHLFGSTPFNVTDGTLTISARLINQAGSLTAAGFTKSGAGTMNLSNASNNFTGNVNINAGEVRLTAGNNTAATTGLGNMNSAKTVTVSSGAKLVLAAQDALAQYQNAGNSTLVVNGGTIENDNNSFNAVGALVLMNGGTIRTTGGNVGNGALQLRNNVTVSGTSGSFITTTDPVKGLINLGGVTTTSGRTTFNVGTTGDLTADLTVSAVLKNEVLQTSGGLNKIGTGKMVLSGANTYAGFTVVNEGILRIQNSAALGSSSGGGALTIVDGFTTNGATLEIDGSLNIAESFLVRGYGDTAKAVFDAVSGSSTFTGNIITYGNSASNVRINVATGASLTHSGGVISNSGDLDPGYGAQVNGITKTGGGSLVLNSANTYVGTTTINGGILAVNGSLASASAVTVNSGGTLAGSGTVGGTTTVHGTHAAGNSGVGLQTFSSSLNYDTNSSIFAWELGSETEGARGTNYDAVNVGSTLSVADSIFKVIVSGLDISGAFWDADHTWDVFNKASSGTFNTFELYNASNLTSQVNYNTHGSFAFDTATGDLKWNFTAVPEPTSALAAVLLGAGFLRRRRAA